MSIAGGGYLGFPDIEGREHNDSERGLLVETDHYCMPLNAGNIHVQVPLDSMLECASYQYTPSLVRLIIQGTIYTPRRVAGEEAGI